MGYCRLGLAALAVLGLLVIAKPNHATAAPALAPGTMKAALQAGTSTSPALSMPVLFHHSQRTQSFYCYPRNYWWFYRPYTTAYDNHARCMPYFHYLDPYGRGGRPDRAIK
jgi:hypothetical protein